MLTASTFREELGATNLQLAVNDDGAIRRAVIETDIVTALGATCMAHVSPKATVSRGRSRGRRDRL